MSKQIAGHKRQRYTGRGKDHTFLRLPHYLIQSPQWRELSGNAIKFLVELAGAFNGRNNGDLSLTRRQALDRGWNSAQTRDRAAEEAVEAGFAVLTRQGGRNGICNLYAITWEPIDEVGKGITYKSEPTASNLWRELAGKADNGARGAL